MNCTNTHAKSGDTAHKHSNNGPTSKLSFPKTLMIFVSTNPPTNMLPTTETLPCLIFRKKCGKKYQVPRNLVDTNASDCRDIKNLTQSNQELENQLGYSNANIFALRQTISTLQSQINKLNLSVGRGSDRGIGGGGYSDRLWNTRNQSIKFYCWLHGRTQNG